MSMPRAAAANGLAKILNESKDPVLFSCRHVAAAVQFLSQSSSVAVAGGIGKSDPVEADGRGRTRCAETVRSSTTGDIRKRGREEKTRQKVRDRSARGELTSIRDIRNRGI
ncbi:unnamed protein product [Lasius platythorax]|uniref:Uncharacterized protein n=1 Tax=Lasius platythorax TaxID=488582 RepID=A0AAV2NTW0_9HYME